MQLARFLNNVFKKDGLNNNSYKIVIGADVTDRLSIEYKKVEKWASIVNRETSGINNGTMLFSFGFALVNILLSFFYHLGSVFATVTCRYKQPNLHYFALVIIYVVLGTTFIGSVIFVSDSSRNKEGYKLSRTGIAFICFWNFLFPFYLFFLLYLPKTHTLCILVI